MKKAIAAGLILILAAALSLRLHYVLTAQYAPLDWDQLEYTKTAVQLLDKGIYAYRSTEPNTLVTPGWPLLLAGILAVFGHEPLEPALMAVRVLNCWIALGAIVLLFLTGRRLFNPLTGLLAAGLAAVQPSYIWSCSLILTEVPFLTAFMGLIYMQVRVLQDNRRRDHLWMGLLLGVCVLLRPNSLPMAVVPYALLWWKHKRVEPRTALLAAAAFAAVMLPWWVRNWHTFHTFIFIAKGEAGNPFLGGTDPYFRGTIDWTGMESKDQFAEGLRRIREGFVTEPLLWLRWMTVGKLAVFFKTMWVGPYPFSVPGWYFTGLGKLNTYTLGLGWATMLAFAWRSLAVRYLLGGFAVFLAVHMLFIPVNRYAYAMLPFMMLAAAWGAVQLAGCLRSAGAAAVTALLQWKRV